MKDVIKYIETKKNKYPFVFNLNVIQAICEKYGKKDGLNKWAELVFPSNKNEKEQALNMDYEALFFFFKECVNEGIDMENDPESDIYVKRENPRSFITEKQAARIITAVDNFESFALNTVVESNGIDTEKNLMTEQNQKIQE